MYILKQLFHVINMDIKARNDLYNTETLCLIELFTCAQG